MITAMNAVPNLDNTVLIQTDANVCPHPLSERKPYRY